jgi:hypothetical protein
MNVRDYFSGETESVKECEKPREENDERPQLKNMT